MRLAQDCYAASEGFSSAEVFGLTGQLRRAGVSLPSTIAEGSARGSSREFVRFLHIAYGSACEVETQALIAERLGMGEQRQSDHVIEGADEVRGMIHALIKHVRKDYDRTSPA
jgi:four helix bundle protein